jgi:hypothetical protein
MLLFEVRGAELPPTPGEGSATDVANHDGLRGGHWLLFNRFYLYLDKPRQLHNISMVLVFLLCWDVPSFKSF